MTNSHNTIFGQTTGNLATLPGAIGVGGFQPTKFGQTLAATANTNLFGGVIGNNSGFLGFLQALQIEGVAKILAQPRLVTKSGQAATFLDGGEYPIPVVGALSAAAGVTYKKFGTQLTFLPIVLGNGRIHLEVEP